MSARQTPEWVKPGAVVVMTSTGGWSVRYGEERRIEKVFKNGNFTLEGSKDQYSPESRGVAYRAGSGRYRSDHCELLTEEVKANIAVARELRDARIEIRNEIDRLSALRADDDIIAEAKLIRARRQP